LRVFDVFKSNQMPPVSHCQACDHRPSTTNEGDKMLDNLPPPTATLRLYQVSHERWMPPVIVAAMAPERAAAIATYGRTSKLGLPESIVVIDVTDEFVALSPIAALHVQALISDRVEGVVAYDAEDGWAYEALR
jgi:hypothetical protein